MRLKSLQSYLKQQKIGALILTHDDPNLTYITGIKPTFGFLKVSPREAHLFISNLDLKPILKNISVEWLRPGWEKKLYQSKIKKIGINENILTINFYKKLKKIYPSASLVDLSTPLARFRSIKTTSEIRKIRKAAQIMDQSFSQFLKNIHHLTTEQEAADFLDRKMQEQGAELAFPTIVASGKNSAVPHHKTSAQRLSKGFLLIDFGARHQGYCADMTRMLYLGKPTKLEQQTYDMLLSIQEKSISEIKLNKPLAELNRLVRKRLGKYSSHFIHSLGHGVGLEIHEAPKVSLDSKEKALKNMVFTIEPGIYFPNRFGLRIEDTVLFDGKTKVLTTTSKKLILV